MSAAAIEACQLVVGKLGGYDRTSIEDELYKECKAALDELETAPLRLHGLQEKEHAAWLDVGQEFKALGLDMNAGGNAERLHDATTRWGEELAQLRLNDPDPSHAESALDERRVKYARHNVPR